MSDTNRTTPALESATHSHAATDMTDRDFYRCPDWCERTDHDVDNVAPDTPPTHYGPSFGTGKTEVITQALGFAPALEFEVLLSDDGYSDRLLQSPEARSSSIAKARELASNLTAAAEWVEGAQR